MVQLNLRSVYNSANTIFYNLKLNMLANIITSKKPQDPY